LRLRRPSHTVLARAVSRSRGSYHLIGKTSSGNPSGFEPDGDSMQFKPDQPTLLERWNRVGSPYRVTSIGSTQLRFEGIDALELHLREAGSHARSPTTRVTT
jgi:hypothetical protein